MFGFRASVVKFPKCILLVVSDFLLIICLLATQWIEGGHKVKR